MNFGKRFLQRPEFFFAGGTVLRIWIYDVVFLDIEVVVIVNAEQPQRPIDRLERGLSFQQIDADRKVVRPKLLFASPEKFRTVWLRRAHAARRRQFARFELKKIFGGDVEENVLIDDRRVAFEFALQIGMPEMEIGLV